VGEGGSELESATADVGLVVAEEADGGVGGNGGAGLVDFLFGDEYAAGENEGAGALAAGGKLAFDQKDVETGFGAGFGWGGHTLVERKRNATKKAKGHFDGRNDPCG
jgi:hypothetical protein